MNKQFVITAAVLGLLAVVAGAFGAHGLKARLSAADLENWKTAVSYQFYHVLAILLLSSLAEGTKNYLNLAYYSFVIGILLFSGSLYLLATRSIMGISSAKILGPLTPVGGLFLIIGWIFLLLSALRPK